MVWTRKTRATVWTSAASRRWKARSRFYAVGTLSLVCGSETSNCTGEGYNPVIQVKLFLILALGLLQSATPDDVVLGRLTLTLSESLTAQTFHMVDQLSQWDPATHRAYGRWTRTHPLDAADRAMLETHATMRRARGWGDGFEPAFIVNSSIEAAAASAVERNLLTADEAAKERDILLNFAPKLASLRDDARPAIAAFRAQLLKDRDRLSPFVERLLRFAEISGPRRVPIFIVANPEVGSGGGRATGNRVVIEVPSPDPMGTLLHETVHEMLASKAGEIRAAAESVGLSFVALNEGITHAIAPGLTDDPAQRDWVSEQLGRYLQAGAKMTDVNVQSFAIAGLLRPQIRSALDTGETFTTFLPKAVERWRVFSRR